MARHTPVDPSQLLKALSSLLSKEGGIKGVTEVTKILILMRGAKKMVSRCIYMNILIATKASAVQEKFIEEGGWELLNTWLQDAKTEEQNPVILELIKVFKELPVTIDILKKNNTAKIIKSFSKTEGEDELKAMADDLVATWKGIIRTSNTDKVDKEKSPSMKKKLKAKKVGKSFSNDGDADDESEEPLAKKSRLGSNDDEPMDTSDTSKPSRLRHPSDSRTTRAGAANKVATRKNSSEEPVKKEGEGKKEDVVKKKRAAIMRPAHSKMRLTGLEKESELPLPKFKKKAPVVPLPKTEKPIPTLTIRKDGPIFSKSLSPTEKRPRPDELTKPGANTHGRIKIIPAKHKLQESSGFLDALNAPSLVVKKKIPKKVARTNSTGSVKAKSPTPPEEIKVEPPKFSFYSSNQPAEEEEKKEEEAEKMTVETDPKETKDTKEPKGGKEEGDMGDDWNEDRPITIGKSNLKFGPSKSKKSVRWKEETDLVDVYYFELDETERVNVNKVKDFQDAMQIDKMNEKQAIKNAIKMAGHTDDEERTNGKVTLEYFQWRRPVLMELPGVPVSYGCNSQEKTVQTKREQMVLREIFFDQMNLPLTPKEPDPEVKRGLEETGLIPLEDESSAEVPDVEPLFIGDQPPFMPPHGGPGSSGGIGHGGMRGTGLLGPAPGGHPGGHQVGHPGGSPRGPMQQQQQQQQRPPPGQGNTPPSPNTTIKNVQNLLATLSEGGTDNAGSDLLKKENLDKLKEMLEPFKNQNPGDNQQREDGNAPQFHPGHGPGHGPGPGNFGGPGDFGPHNDHGGPFPPMGPDGPMGMGPDGPMGMGPDGPMGMGPGRGPRPRGPHFDGPGMGPGGQFHPQFGPGPGPNFPGPRGMGMGPPGRGGGFPDRGRGHPGRGMGPRGPWRGGRGGSKANDGRRQVCYHFQSERGCLRGNSCFFLHPGVNQPPL
ncbi:serine/threonine-protein phosphatase 1 regulatory subunit 10 isoform X2 [Strongylocentrotus purpuratus]|uniref:Serine/threonine-protein phosphatase 1 regulatory subunit 10 n=1 Tax=Strongylocentrotus purpuratus TaxID=7668 RepID=A0A7M7T4I0_STRPU|nr:serine/threonine-protein phosphatase 1 regulatory subunit 10 isoform X2 [Strongylocentrotus purpuratus]